jgi:hypothetical protein
MQKSYAAADNTLEDSAIYATAGAIFWFWPTWFRAPDKTLWRRHTATSDARDLPEAVLQRFSQARRECRRTTRNEYAYVPICAARRATQASSIGPFGPDVRQTERYARMSRYRVFRADQAGEDDTERAV